jgi:methionyl-tRNA formyltransferase
VSARPEDVRVFLFGNRGYMSIVFPELVRAGWRIVGVCASEPPPLMRTVRARVGQALRVLGLREDTDFNYTDPFEGLSRPKAIASRHAIPFFPSASLRSDAFQQEVHALQPDVILVAGFHRLIPAAVVNSARRAAINLHPSLLPRHRGGTPNRWIVRNGENETGLSAHWLDQSFDTGDIILQQRVGVGPHDCWGDVEVNILAALPGFIKQTMALVLAGDVPRHKQDEACATYEPSYKGSRVRIDWEQSPEDIRRTCLAIRPKSGGRARIKDVPICIWEVRESENAGPGGSAGEVVGFDETANPIVRCGHGGAVRIMSTLRNGAIRSGADMARRLGLRRGDQFEARPLHSLVSDI